MVTLIAAVIAAIVATIGYAVTVRAKLLEDRRKTYADALAAVHAYQSLPHRIRRRDDGSSEAASLGHEISTIQQNLDYYRNLLYLDSPELGDGYTALVQASRDQGKKYRDQAWERPPALSYPETYRYKVTDEMNLCLRRMRRHLR
ncbi:MAG TPA: hypothetical protein VFD73_12875 [Gemmatimonadales bacterium]|nr:hypothetical protein [Gemmatimonadales bacterium]